MDKKRFDKIFNAPKLEKTIEADLRDGINARGGHSYKFTSPGHRSVPDRLNLLPIPPEHQAIVARYVQFVEMKREGAGATPAQAREHQKLRDLGFDVRVVAGDKELKSYFEEMDLCRL